MVKFWEYIENAKSVSNGNVKELSFQLEARFMDMESNDFMKEVFEPYGIIKDELLANIEFETLYESKDVIINDNDNMDNFMNWFIMQGKELYYEYKKYGVKAIVNYIKSNNISKEDYTYDNIGFAFVAPLTSFGDLNNE